MKSEKMRAIVVPGDGTVRMETISIPQPGEYEVLLKTKACAICGTDSKFIDGAMKGLDEYPALLGHEAVGEVVALGPKVRNYRLGDTVVAPFMWRELDGFIPYWGAMAEYVTTGDYEALLADGMGDTVEAEMAYLAKRIPGDMDPVQATMIITLRETLSAIKKFGFQAGESVVVYGAGPVGASFIRFCKLLGMSPVICVELQEERREAAVQAGADHVIVGSNEDVAMQIRRICPNGVNNTLDAAGVPQLINENLKLIAQHGKVCVYGETAENRLLLDWDKAPYAFSIMVDQMIEGTREVHDAVMEYIREEKVNCMDYISDVFSFDDAMDAFTLYRKKGNKKKIVLEF